MVFDDTFGILRPRVLTGRSLFRATQPQPPLVSPKTISSPRFIRRLASLGLDENH
jgi:hypothetical protein